MQRSGHQVEFYTYQAENVESSTEEIEIMPLSRTTILRSGTH